MTFQGLQRKGRLYRTHRAWERVHKGTIKGLGAINATTGKRQAMEKRVVVHSDKVEESSQRTNGVDEKRGNGTTVHRDQTMKLMQWGIKEYEGSS